MESMVAQALDTVAGGAFVDDMELLAGVQIELPPYDARQGRVVAKITTLLSRALSTIASVGSRRRLLLSETSAPRPDVLVMPNAAADPSDCLVIEIASSRWDSGLRMPLYAAADVCEYWLVDPRSSTVEIFLDPSRDVFQRTVLLRAGDTIYPHRWPMAALSVADIFAP
jgi:Uma2 family endonuclease